jgi:hypothetical protein
MSESVGLGLVFWERGGNIPRLMGVPVVQLDARSKTAFLLPPGT